MKVKGAKPEQVEIRFAKATKPQSPSRRLRDGRAHVKLEFLLRYGWWWFRWIRLPAWSVFVLWILFQIIGAWEQVKGISSVSALAHLGGAAMGFVAWLLWRNESRPAQASHL